jgi:hypothetical protein
MARKTIKCRKDRRVASNSEGIERKAVTPLLFYLFDSRDQCALSPTTAGDGVSKPLDPISMVTQSKED